MAVASGLLVNVSRHTLENASTDKATKVRITRQTTEDMATMWRAENRGQLNLILR